MNKERLSKQRTGKFLAKVKEEREERRWEIRGEDVRYAFPCT
jgi:hypothetical protein